MSQALDCFEVVNLRESRGEDLLHAFYSELYLPAFPIVSEREDPTVWLPRLWGPGGRLEFHLVLVGTNLGDPSRRTLAAGIAFELYRESWCGLLTYLVVAPPFRRRGLGASLIGRAQQTLHDRTTDAGGRLQAVFGETNDPRRVTADQDSMDPWQRLRAITRMGGRVVPMRYVQPELVPGQGRARQLLLMAFPSSASQRDSIDAACVISFLEDFYRTHGIDDPLQDAEFRDMIHSIPGPRISLVDTVE